MLALGYFNNLIFGTNGDRPGGPPKAPKRIEQQIFKPSVWTASEKAAEGKAAKAHAECVAGYRQHRQIGVQQ
jgi:hypothetical protein